MEQEPTLHASSGGALCDVQRRALPGNAHAGGSHQAREAHGCGGVSVQTSQGSYIRVVSFALHTRHHLHASSAGKALAEVRRLPAARAARARQGGAAGGCAERSASCGFGALQQCFTSLALCNAIRSSTGRSGKSAWYRSCGNPPSPRRSYSLFHSATFT